MANQDGTPIYSARQVLRVAIGSGGTGLVVGLVASSFSAAGIVDMTVAAAMLLAAWVIGTVSITVSEPVWGLAPRYRLGASLGTIAILTILLAGIGWFQHNHLPIPDKGAAQMTLSRVDIEGIPKTSAYQFNAVIHNDGTASAIEENTAVAGKLSDHLLSKDDIDVIMAKLEKFNLAIERQGPLHFQIPKSHSRVITLSEVDDLDTQVTKKFIQATANQIKEITNGDLSLYVFLLTKYEDETITGNGYWQTETCGYYTASFVHYHLCRPLKISKVGGPRPRN